MSNLERVKFQIKSRLLFAKYLHDSLAESLPNFLIFISTLCSPDANLVHVCALCVMFKMLKTKLSKENPLTSENNSLKKELQSVHKNIFKGTIYFLKVSMNLNQDLRYINSSQKFPCI